MLQNANFDRKFFLNAVFYVNLKKYQFWRKMTPHYIYTPPPFTRKPLQNN